MCPSSSVFDPNTLTCVVPEDCSGTTYLITIFSPFNPFNQFRIMFFFLIFDKLINIHALIFISQLKKTRPWSLRLNRLPVRRRKASSLYPVLAGMIITFAFEAFLILRWDICKKLNNLLRMEYIWARAKNWPNRAQYIYRIILFQDLSSWCHFRSCTSWMHATWTRFLLWVLLYLSIF